MLFYYLNFIKEDFSMYKKWVVPFIYPAWFIRSIIMWIIMPIGFPLFVIYKKYESKIDYIRYSVYKINDIYDFYSKIKDSLSDRYVIEYNKTMGYRIIDIYIRDMKTDDTYVTLFRHNLPPETVVPFTKLKNEIGCDHMVVLSSKPLTESVVDIFEKSGIKVMTYDNTQLFVDRFVKNMKSK